MSYDLNITAVCDHRIYREQLTLEDDRRSLRFDKPLSSSNIDLYASENLVPKTAYTIIYDPQTITVQQPRMIHLRNRWKQIEDYFEVIYITFKGFCPKCAGLEVINDIQYDIRGQLRKIRNEDLLLQNLEKFTVTEIQSNAFHTFIGTSLTALLGQRITDTSYVSSKITQEVNTTLDVLKSLQDQYVSAGRTVTDGELFDTIENVRVRFDEEDPTIIRTDVTVLAKSGRSVDFTQYLQLPTG
jgi:hypothetical protein